jgi:hypothetical protein
MDQFYVEEGYVEAGYFVVVRDSGVITVDSAFSTSATVGVVKPFASSQSAAFNVAAALGQLQTADSAITSEFTQTATAERVIVGSALVSSVSSVSVQATRTLSLASTLSSSFTLDSALSITREAGSDLISTASTSASVGIVKSADFSVSATSTVLAVPARIRGVNIALTDAFSATIGVIINTDIVTELNTASSLLATVSKVASFSTTLENIVNLSMQGVGIFDAESTFNVEATVTADYLVTQQSSALLQAAAFLTADAISFNKADDDYGDRPRIYVPVAGTPAISPISKFGAGSAVFDGINYSTFSQASTDFLSIKTIDYWVYENELPEINGGGGGVNIIKWDNDGAAGSEGIFILTHRATYFNGYRQQILFRTFINGVFELRNASSVAYTPGEWDHVRFQLTPTGARIWYNGIELLLGQDTSVSDNTPPYVGTAPPLLGDLGQSGQTAVKIQIDELLITNTLLTPDEVSSFTPPTAPYQFTSEQHENEILLLSHFDTAFLDDIDISITIVSADLTVTSTLAANVSAVFDSAALVVSSATLTSQINAIFVDSATLNSSSALDVNGGKLVGVDAALSSVSSLDVIIGEIEPATIALSTVSTIVIDASAIVVVNATFNTVSTVDCFGDVLTNIFVPLNTTATMVVTPIAFYSGASVLLTEISLLGTANSTGTASSNMNAEFTVSAAVSSVVIEFIVYKVPKETRTFSIVNETRSYFIPNEQRINIIRRK